ncbi:MAG: glycosyltransferase [Candidatus Moraniibacteriota bacterium]|jgi:GT2 family glycosyltransferase
MSTIYIITPTWNNADYTIRCFKSVAKNTENYKIIWVDNGSNIKDKKEVKDFLMNNDIPYILISNEKNLGFVKATNQGVKLALNDKVKKIVLLNNDVEVYAGWLERMARVLNSDEKMGIVGTVVSPTEGSWQSVNNLKNKVDGFADFPEYKKDNEGYAKKVAKRYDRQVLADYRYIAFFCALIRSEVFEDIGLLAEEYGIGFGDDNDFNHRAMNAGWRVALAKDVFIFHNHRTTFKSIYSENEIVDLQKSNKKILDQKFGKGKYRNKNLENINDIDELRCILRDQKKENNKQIQENNRQVLELKESRSFRLGDLFFRSLRKPYKLLTFPFNLFKIITEKPSTKDALLRAYKLFKIDNDKEESLLHAKKNVSKKNRDAIDILSANMNIGNEEKWLKHINAYLEGFRLAPVFLKKNKNTLFDRFHCKIEKNIVDGPVVSVIMPVYNAEDTIEMAVDSVLSQTWKNIELIIINDKSSDNTWDIIQSLANNDERIKIINNKQNVGPYVSKNIALKQVSGDYITGHDADDWAHPQRIERQMEDIIDTNAKVVLARMLRLTYQGEFQIQEEDPFSKDGVMRVASISCLIERTFLEKYIGYWDNIKYGADSEFIGRLRAVVDKDEFIDQYFVSMFCLNEAGSLTNHPDTGTNTNNGISEIRKKYSKSHKKWHESINISNCYIDFPQKNRKFFAPTDMIVDTDDIN